MVVVVLVLGGFGNLGLLLRCCCCGLQMHACRLLCMRSNRPAPDLLLAWLPTPCLPSSAPPARPACRYDFKQLKAKEGQASKLLFKKRMFRETDETITEPQFVNLSYIQAQHDYLQVRRSAGV